MKKTLSILTTTFILCLICVYFGVQLNALEAYHVSTSSGDFITISDTLDANKNKEEYDITVDFSEKSSMAVALVNTSQPVSSSISVTLFDEEGNELEYTNQYGYQKTSISVGEYCGKLCYTFENPTNDTIHIFKAVVSVPEGQEGSFRLMIGDEAKKESMISGIQNVSMIRTYENMVTSKQISLYSPNMEENWFGFIAEKETTTITFHNDRDLEFKIFDSTTNELKYSTELDNESERQDYISSFYKDCQKCKLENLDMGQLYYIVFYAKEVNQNPYYNIMADTFNVAIGDPVIYEANAEFHSNNTVTCSPDTYSTPVTISVKGLPDTAYVTRVGFRTKTSGVHSWDVPEQKYKLPMTYIWQYCPRYDPYFSISEGYKANGNWQVSVKAGSETISLKPGFRVNYKYELGD